MTGLPIPRHDRDAKKMELLRVWLIDGAPSVVITPNLWEDPEMWGLMLADLMRHVGNSYEADGRNFDEVLSRIKAAFDAEWGHPTSSVDELDN
jgi:hypothetical protein